uniref:C2H2-type domain-containing protein n=1 Tax=Heterorhabditis bacteriophora TaxID=37862 RepID=A0A1I7XTR5_HETBA
MKKNYNEYELMVLNDFWLQIRETANAICEEYEKKRDSVELSDITADQEEDCCLHALSSEEGSAVLEPDSRDLIVRGTSFDVPISHPSSALPAPDCFTCDHCGIVYIDYLLWLLHMSFHSRTGDPLKCALCGVHSSDRYEFAAHVYSTSHFLK